MSHVGILVLFSLLVGSFFSLLTRETLREAVKLFLILTGSMILLSLLVAYLMYPFPLG